MIFYRCFVNWNYNPWMRLFVILLTITVSSSQSRIDGQIIDKETGIPLIGVNVFF